MCVYVEGVHYIRVTLAIYFYLLDKNITHVQWLRFVFNCSKIYFHIFAIRNHALSSKKSIVISLRNCIKHLIFLYVVLSQIDSNYASILNHWRQYKYTEVKEIMLVFFSCALFGNFYVIWPGFYNIFKIFNRDSLFCLDEEMCRV